MDIPEVLQDFFFLPRIYMRYILYKSFTFLYRAYFFSVFHINFIFFLFELRVIDLIKLKRSFREKWRHTPRNYFRLQSVFFKEDPKRNCSRVRQKAELKWYCCKSVKNILLYLVTNVTLSNCWRITSSVEDDDLVPVGKHTHAHTNACSVHSQLMWIRSRYGFTQFCI